MGKNKELMVGVINLDALGHKSIGQNQEQIMHELITSDPELRNVEVNYKRTVLFQQDGWIEKMPLPTLVKAGLRGWMDFAEVAKNSDVVIVNQQNIAALCYFEMLSRPTILVSDATPKQLDLLPAYGQPAAQPIVEKVKTLMNTLNYRRADACVGWSSWTKSSLVNDYGVPDEKTFSIPPGVNIDYWASEEDTNETQDKKGLDILFVGGDFTRKGGKTLLKAFKKNPGENRLHIVTSTKLPESDSIRVYNDLSNSDPRLLQLYKEADVFVLPTLGDATPVVLMEATAARLPVISTKIGGIPSLVEGDASILIEPGNVEQLVDAINQLHDRDRRIFMGNQARALAEAKFDARKNTAQLLRLAMSVA